MRFDEITRKGLTPEEMEAIREEIKKKVLSMDRSNEKFMSKQKPPTNMENQADQPSVDQKQPEEQAVTESFENTDELFKVDAQLGGPSEFETFSFENFENQQPTTDSVTNWSGLDHSLVDDHTEAELQDEQSNLESDIETSVENETQEAFQPQNLADTMEATDLLDDPLHSKFNNPIYLEYLKFINSDEENSVDENDQLEDTVDTSYIDIDQDEEVAIEAEDSVENVPIETDSIESVNESDALFVGSQENQVDHDLQIHADVNNSFSDDHCEEDIIMKNSVIEVSIGNDLIGNDSIVEDIVENDLVAEELNTEDSIAFDVIRSEDTPFPHDTQFDNSTQFDLDVQFEHREIQDEQRTTNMLDTAQDTFEMRPSFLNTEDTFAPLYRTDEELENSMNTNDQNGALNREKQLNMQSNLHSIDSINNSSDKVAGFSAGITDQSTRQARQGSVLSSIRGEAGIGAQHRGTVDARKYSELQSMYNDLLKQHQSLMYRYQTLENESFELADEVVRLENELNSMIQKSKVQESKILEMQADMMKMFEHTRQQMLEIMHKVGQ